MDNVGTPMSSHIITLLIVHMMFWYGWSDEDQAALWYQTWVVMIKIVELRGCLYVT